MPNDHENDSETLGEKNNCGRREGDLHPLLQAGTHLALVAMRPDKKRLKKTAKIDRKEICKVFLLKANLKGVIC